MPAAASLAVGELALNTADGSLYAKIANVVTKVQTQITVYSALVDFGTIPDNAGLFTVSIADALLTDRVVASISGDVPGSMIDELEMDPLVVYGHVTAAGVIEFLVSTIDPSSYVTGQRYINFYMG